MILASIDVGTNTALLLVAEIDEEGRLTPLHQARRFVRLGEGVDASGEIGPAALGRLREALQYYRTLARSWKADHVVVAATSASRDARNQSDVETLVHEALGVPVEILSGDAEARWTFAGALSGLPDLAETGSCLVIDIGGGSTELVLGPPGLDPTAQHSLNIGAVRLTERFYPAQPPRPADVRRAQAYVQAQLQTLPLTPPPGTTLVASSGTVLVLTLLHRGVTAWDDLSDPTAPLTIDEVRRWRERLHQMTRSDVLRLNPVLLEGRADVFPAGVMICEAIMEAYGFQTCRVSPHGLRHGLALRYGLEEMKDREPSRG